MKPLNLIYSQSDGVTRHLADNITKNWLIGLRQTNPAILDMFADRDKLPYRDMLPWSGEFAGTYITGAYYIYRLTKNEDLRRYIETFIDELISLQDSDGYLGCFSKNCRLTGAYSSSPERTGDTWDSWSHYHIMYGLLMWYGVEKNQSYLDTAKKIAELFIATFYGDNQKRIVDIGYSEMNLAPIHSFAMLYNLTGKKKYLDFALKIEEDISDERAGNYINHSQNGLEYYQCPKPRWESMHIIMGIAELYRATQKEYYRDVAVQIYSSIQKTDVHNTGAFSTNEAAIGNPFGSGSIESCCVIAYNALAVEIFKLTHDPSVIDFLEISHYNACMGMWSPSGRWSTYDTPMNGDRRANYHHIVFQSRPGSPELNCCSVNAARSVGNISEWMFTYDNDTLYINAFEQGSYTDDKGVKIDISGSYPAPGEIRISVKNYKGKLALRIPAWSKNTEISVNGAVCNPDSGKYFLTEIDDDTDFTVNFDFSVRYLTGHGEQEGLFSIYRGPVLYGVDVTGIENQNINELSPVSKKRISETPVKKSGDMLTVPIDENLTLRDFYHLGQTGCIYRTWLPLSD